MSAIEQLDKYFEDVVSNEQFEEFLAQNHESQVPELLWRMAKAARIVSMRSSHDTDKKKKYCSCIPEYAKKGLELDDNNAGCHKWYSIGLMNVAEGPQDRMKNVHIVKEHFDRAVELDPKDPHARHVLGTWYFRIADLPWLMKKMLSAIQSNLPTATYEQALEQYQEAEKIQPNFFGRNSLMLGKTHLRMKDNAKAKEFLQKAMDFPCKYPIDDQTNKEAKDLLKGL